MDLELKTKNGMMVQIFVVKEEFPLFYMIEYSKKTNSPEIAACSNLATKKGI